MSLPNPFPLLRADSLVVSLLGDSNGRIRAEEGRAKQGTAYPYVTWTVVDMIPQIELPETPKADACRVQVDCWADNRASVREVAIAVRDAIEPFHDMTTMQFYPPDPETNAYRAMLEFAFWLPRETASS